jgi:hypothetical protein
MIDSFLFAGGASKHPLHAKLVFIAGRHFNIGILTATNEIASRIG